MPEYILWTIINNFVSFCSSVFSPYWKHQFRNVFSGFSQYGNEGFTLNEGVTLRHATQEVTLNVNRLKFNSRAMLCSPKGRNNKGNLIVRIKVSKSLYPGIVL